MQGKSVIFPGFRYTDAPAAIDFLCNAFGFERHAVYTDEADPSIVHHAQLTLGNSMIMLGSHRGGEVTQLYGFKLPGEVGGVTSATCVFVEDPDAHHATAKAAGADVIRSPYDNDGYPGRAYDVRDTEGYVWNFGSYDPWSPHE